MWLLNRCSDSVAICCERLFVLNFDIPYDWQTDRGSNFLVNSDLANVINT